MTAKNADGQCDPPAWLSPNQPLNWTRDATGGVRGLNCNPAVDMLNLWDQP